MILILSKPKLINKNTTINLLLILQQIIPNIFTRKEVVVAFEHRPG